jgi:lipopolysaccharide transport system permease protein
MSAQPGETFRAPSHTASPPLHGGVTVIEPPRGWRMLDVRELWSYRELLAVLARRDIQVRYKQAVLGAAWAVVRPVTTMVIFWMIFGKLARMPSDGVPYPLFVLAALVPWNFFASATASAGQSLMGSSHLITKVYFPRLIIPLAATGAALADLVVSAVLMVLMLAVFGGGPSLHWLAIAPLVALLVFVAVGFGTLLAALTVSYRDFAHLTPFLLQVWMFATPVVFPVSSIPPQWRWLLHLNPVTGIVEGFRSAFLGRPFDLPAIAGSALAGAVVFVIGVAYFEKVERRFADII